MPSNQMDINIELGTSQSDVQAMAKLTEALKAAGATGGVSGARIQQPFGTVNEGVQFLKDQQAAQKEFGGKLSGAYVRTEPGGGVTAGAQVDDQQKKAFSPGGMIATIGTGVGVSVGIFKTILGMSKIVQTFMSTTGKILGTAVDLMLAPLMPFIVRIMVWLLQKVFPLAIKVGNWIDEGGPAAAATALIGGYVALKFGPTLLAKAGESLGIALVNKMPYETLGANISAGISLARKTLVNWGTVVGGYIVDGFKAGKAAMIIVATAIGNAVVAAYTGAKAAMVAIGTAIGIGQAGGFIGMKATMVLIGGAIGTAMGLAFTGMRAAFIFLGTAIGVAMGGGFTGSNLAMTALATKLGLAMGAAFTGMRGAMVAIGTAIGLAQGGSFIGMKATMVLIGGAIGTAMGAAFTGMKLVLVAIGTAIGLAQGGSFIGMKATMVLIGTAIGLAQGGSFIGMKATMVLIGGAIGTAMGAAFTGMKLVLVAIGTAIGTAMRVAFMAGRGAMIALGGLIGISMGTSAGTSFAGSSSLGRAATFVGGAIAGAIRTAPAWVAVGGVVAAALGAAAIGAAIGYAMWKSYKAHEAGKDLFAGKDVSETYTMLREAYGVRPDAAVDLSQAVAGVGQTGIWKDKISVTKDAFEDFINSWRQIEELATTDAPMSMFASAFKRLDQSEAEFILNQLKDIVTPERLALLYEEAAKLGTIVSKIMPHVTAEVTAKASIYDYNQETLGNKALIDIGGGMRWAGIFAHGDEKKFREILNNLYEVTKFTETEFTWASLLPEVPRPWKIDAAELSRQDIEIAMAVMMTKYPEHALRFIPPAEREGLGWGEWGTSELERAQRNQDIKIYINDRAVGWDIDPLLLDKVIAILDLERKGAVTPP